MTFWKSFLSLVFKPCFYVASQLLRSLQSEAILWPPAASPPPALDTRGPGLAGHTVEAHGWGAKPKEALDRRDTFDFVMLCFILFHVVAFVGKFYLLYQTIFLACLVCIIVIGLTFITTCFSRCLHCITSKLCTRCSTKWQGLCIPARWLRIAHGALHGVAQKLAKLHGEDLATKGAFRRKGNSMHRELCEPSKPWICPPALTVTLCQSQNQNLLFWVQRKEKTRPIQTHWTSSCSESNTKITITCPERNPWANSAPLRRRAVPPWNDAARSFVRGPEESRLSASRGREAPAEPAELSTSQTFKVSNEAIHQESQYVSQPHLNSLLGIEA